MDLGIVAALGFTAAFLMSWLVQPHFRNLGFLTEIVDHPGYRRPHREPVPRTGGMAIFISFFCALFFLENVILRTSLPWSWLSILTSLTFARSSCRPGSRSNLLQCQPQSLQSW